jgi:hypothetical protein
MNLFRNRTEGECYMEILNYHRASKEIQVVIEEYKARGLQIIKEMDMQQTITLVSTCCHIGNNVEVTRLQTNAVFLHQHNDEFDDC